MEWSWTILSQAFTPISAFMSSSLPYSKGDRAMKEHKRPEEKIGSLLRRSKATLSVAESCTGGLIAHRITNVSGSSDYFEMGIVSYTNRSKVELLSVPERDIDLYGAVSQQVA
ncbi:MAG: nicotinamide-nucleotide amidohydrolase family protein, partial [Proteobacteria bacterium]|nr:nicotinamide-nucleotide amidohydrolase family protein [Pseudomonadota bacterium]